MIKEAIILAGGMGTRLKELVDDIPKPMALVNNKPFLEYQLNYLGGWCIDHVVLSVGYKSEKIRDYFKDDFYGMKISYANEDAPLGTGGAILNAFELIKGHAAFILNGDTLFDVNLKRLQDFSRIKDTDCSIVLRFVDDVSRYGAVELDSEFRICNFNEKGTLSGDGYINGGVYYINKSYFQSFNFPKKFSLEKDFFEKYINEEFICGIRCFSYFLDIGIPEDYLKAQDEFKALPY